MTEQHTPATQDTADSGAPSGGAAVVGPLTIRDLAVLGAVAIIFIASLIPLVVAPGGSVNLWNTADLFFVGIGMVLPLATGVLFVVRRFSPGATLRLGSLSLDQFASVVAVFAFFFFFAGTVTNFRPAYLVGLIGAVLFTAATTCAPWIPVLAADFAGRAETPSHVVARDAAAPARRSSPTKTAATHAVAPDAAGQAVGAAGWAASRPAVAGHTPAGQIFTPAKDGRPADGDATGAGAAGTGAGAAATGAAATGAGAAATGAATSGGTAGAASTRAASTGAATSGGTAGAGHKQPATTARADAAPEPATTINPQQPAAAKGAAAPDAAKAAAPAKESIAATIDPKAAAPAVIAEPFWFAVDRPQNVIDENTRQFIYKLTPGSWILALEDRGNSFLVQDSHGKTGVLLDLVGIERASDSQ